MSDAPAHAVRPPGGLGGPPPSIPTHIGPIIGGATNVWCEGNVVPVAQQAINPPALQQIFKVARDMLDTIADLGVLGDHVKDLTKQLGGAWSAGDAALNATARLGRIHGCFGTLGEQAGKLQKQTDALGGTLHETMTSMLKTLSISNATCAALGSNPFTAPAAKATAWATVMQIVKWLLTIRTAIGGIAEAVTAIKEVTSDVDATAASLGGTVSGGSMTGTGYPLPAGYGALGTTVPAGSQVPGATPPPAFGYPQYPLTQAGYPQSNVPTVYDAGTYPARAHAPGWVPEAPDGVDADGDRVTITVDNQGGVTVDAPEDRDMKIGVDVAGKHYDFDIDPA